MLKHSISLNMITYVQYPINISLQDQLLNFYKV